MAFLFRGQDRRDIKKSVMALGKCLARDLKAADTTKKTTSISTRQFIFDAPTGPLVSPHPETDAANVMYLELQSKLVLVR